MKVFKTYFSFFAISIICGLSSCDDKDHKTGWIQRASPDPNYNGNSMAVYSFVADNKAYIGSLTLKTSALDWWKYTPASNQWTKEATFPFTEVRSHTFSASDNGKNAYLGLGFSIGQVSNTSHMTFGNLMLTGSNGLSYLIFRDFINMPLIRLPLLL